MCGIVAVVTKNANGLTKEQADAFDNLLFVDCLRGMDSTGVFLVQNNGEMAWAKEAVASPEFRLKQEYRELMSAAFQRGRALVGHNRAATKGSVTDENAHPFTVDDRITLVHNGTLFGDHKTLANVDVDSHAIAHVIHENGDNVEAAMQKVNGAYALVWHDFKNNSLNFLRNTQRPLNWVETQNGWIWASEANMIEWILARYPALKQQGDVALLNEGTLVTYDFTKNSWSVNTKEIKLEAARKTHVYLPPQSNHQRHPYANAYEEYKALTKPVCDIPLRSQINTENMGTRNRLVSEEMKIAAGYKMDLPSSIFMKGNEDIPDHGWQTITCLEHTYAHGDTSKYGYYIYGCLDTKDNYLVKVFIQATHHEYELLDWTLNNRKMSVRVASKGWRSYIDAADGSGFGIVQTSDWKLLEESVKETTGVVNA